MWININFLISKPKILREGGGGSKNKRIRRKTRLTHLTHMSTLFIFWWVWYKLTCFPQNPKSSTFTYIYSLDLSMIMSTGLILSNQNNSSNENLWYSLFLLPPFYSFPIINLLYVCVCTCLDTQMLVKIAKYHVLAKFVAI